MDTSKVQYIRCLDRTNLVKYLKNEKYNVEADILKPRDIDGMRFLEFTELDLLQWKLTPKEKRLLLNCRDKILKEPPQQTKRYPSVPKKPMPPTPTGPNSSFKSASGKPHLGIKLIGIACQKPTSVDNRSGVPNITQQKPIKGKSKPFPNPPNRPPPNLKSHDDYQNSNQSDQNKSSQKLMNYDSKPFCSLPNMPPPPPNLMSHNDYQNSNPTLQETLSEDIILCRTNALSESLETVFANNKAKYSHSNDYDRENIKSPSEINEKVEYCLGSKYVDMDRSKRAQRLLPETPAVSASFNKPTVSMQKPKPNYKKKGNCTVTNILTRNKPVDVEETDDTYEDPNSVEKQHAPRMCTNKSIFPKSNQIKPGGFANNKYVEDDSNQMYEDPDRIDKTLDIPRIPKKSFFPRKNQIKSKSFCENDYGEDNLSQSQTYKKSIFHKNNQTKSKAIICDNDYDADSDQTYELPGRIEEIQARNGANKPSLCNQIKCQNFYSDDQKINQNSFNPEGDEDYVQPDPIQGPNPETINPPKSLPLLPARPPYLAVKPKQASLKSLPTIVKAKPALPVSNKCPEVPPKSKKKLPQFDSYSSDTDVTDNVYESARAISNPLTFPNYDNHRLEKNVPPRPVELPECNVPSPKNSGGKIWNSPDIGALPKPPVFENKFEKAQLTFIRSLIDEDENEIIYNNEFNPNNYRFYRNTDRKGAQQLLERIPNLSDGAFLFRTSEENCLVITMFFQSRFFNVKVLTKQDGSFYCNIANNEERIVNFKTLEQFVEYYKTHPLILKFKDSHIHIYLKEQLPPYIF